MKTEIKDTISLTKTVDKKVVKPGEEATFRIVVHNRGKQTYQNLTLIDNFPLPLPIFLAQMIFEQLIKRRKRLPLRRVL